MKQKVIKFIPESQMIIPSSELYTKYRQSSKNYISSPESLIACLDIPEPLEATVCCERMFKLNLRFLLPALLVNFSCFIGIGQRQTKYVFLFFFSFLFRSASIRGGFLYLSVCLRIGLSTRFTRSIPMSLHDMTILKSVEGKTHKEINVFLVIE